MNKTNKTCQMINYTKISTFHQKTGKLIQVCCFKGMGNCSQSMVPLSIIAQLLQLMYVSCFQNVRIVKYLCEVRLSKRQTD